MSGLSCIYHFDFHANGPCDSEQPVNSSSARDRNFLTKLSPVPMSDPLPRDLWLVIADSFLSRATLYSLCLVSKNLNAIFTPVLYRNVTSLSGYSRWEQTLRKMARLEKETHLRHTRHLDIGYSKHARIVDPKDLRLLFQKMPGLVSCRIWCRPTQVGHFSSPKVTHLTMNFGEESRPLDLPPFPAFENLQSLDLRGLRGNLFKLQRDISRVLFASPNLKRLGLELKTWHVDLVPTMHHGDFLAGIVEYFKALCETNQRPQLHLEIQELIMGCGILFSINNDGTSSHLEELTDLSKLRSLEILNEKVISNGGCRGMFLNSRLLLQATNLNSISMFLLGRDIVGLIDALTPYGCLREIQVRSVKEYAQSEYHWYRPLEVIRGGWTKILLGGHFLDDCPPQNYENIFKTVLSQSKNVREIGLPYIRWDLAESHLKHFPNLRVFLGGYHVPSSESHADLASRDIKPKLASNIFKVHRKAMRDQGLISRLRYVGIGMSVYVLSFWGPTKCNHHSVSTSGSYEISDDFELVELEPEESYTFDFIKTLEKISHRGY